MKKEYYGTAVHVYESEKPFKSSKKGTYTLEDTTVKVKGVGKKAVEGKKVHLDVGRKPTSLVGLGEKLRGYIFVIPEKELTERQMAAILLDLGCKNGITYVAEVQKKDTEIASADIGEINVDRITNASLGDDVKISTGVVSEKELEKEKMVEEGGTHPEEERDMETVAKEVVDAINSVKEDVKIEGEKPKAAPKKKTTKSRKKK